MKLRLTIVVGLICAASVVIVLWVLNGRQVNNWFGIHTGTTNESGPYYGFWSGFGSDLEEFGILGAIGAAIYQLFKKYNCHEPGCWRVGKYSAADGQFLLCYRHHPDYHGQKPTHEVIQRLHREHLERQEAMHNKLRDVHQRLINESAAAPDTNGSGALAPGNHQTAPLGLPAAFPGGQAGPLRGGPVGPLRPSARCSR